MATAPYTKAIVRGFLDRIRQWNVSARTTHPVNSSAKIYHLLTARAASQRSRGKCSILSSKGQKMATKYSNFTRYLEAPPREIGFSPAKCPPSDPYALKQIRRPLWSKEKQSTIVPHCSAIVHSALRINYHAGILVYIDCLQINGGGIARV